MTPEMIILIMRIALEFGPKMGAAIQQLVMKKDPTQADWDNVWSLANEPWKPYVPPVVPVP